MIKLDTPIENLTRIGRESAKHLKKLDLEKVEDLLFHFPFRYDDFGEKKLINELQPDTIACIQGRVKLMTI